MKNVFASAILLLLCGVAVTPADAQAPQQLTLAQADAIALRNRPRLLSAMYTASAAAQTAAEVRAAYFPRVNGSMTGVEAENNTRITAGVLNNPSVFDRYADGITVSQLVTDFGRTHNLNTSANDEAKAQSQYADATRADVLLQVNEAYYRALEAQAVLNVAKEAVNERQVVADQVSALTKNKLKSELDLSFANVNLSQAQLLLVQAQNSVESAFASLSLAMGYSDSRSYQLAEEPLPPAPETDIAALLGQAFQNRPEISGGKLQVASAQAFERAERDLWMPTLSAVGTAGLAPVREAPLVSRYAAAGFNLDIPIFDGGLFTARHAEARLQAEAAGQDLREVQNGIARSVRVAWLDATTAYQRLDLTRQLQQQAVLALQLSQARYKLGLSSIVELSQAQLNETQAEIDQSSAKYDYQIAADTLRFQLGELR